jgi:hypothetical protein
MESMMTHVAQMMIDMEQKMAQKMVHMEQKMAKMEERNAQMEERLEKMEEKMSISIQVNERLTQIVDVQGINIQTLSKLLIIKEEPIVKEEVKDKCRICGKNEIDRNQSVCSDCWRHCEPAIPLTRAGLEAIEQEITSLRTEDEERFWRFHDKFIEQLGEYSQDTMHLFNSNEKEIRKLAEKHEKSVEDIRYCIDKMNYLKSSFGHMDDKVTRIMDVVQHLTEIISGREVAETKFAFMKFNCIESAKGGRLTLDDLV